MGNFSKNSFSIILVLISTILVSFAQVFFKQVWSEIDFISLLSKVIFGFVLYGAGAFLFLLVLRKKKVSYLFPFMTLSYVWVILLSAYLFGESIGLGKILGVSLIFIGIFLIYVGSNGNDQKKVKARTKSIRVEAGRLVR